ncbi:MAG: hypothetical protein Q4C99_11335, partial [Clostridia bacterium]|nr:hypothetical protein [Clostridia bacterium]
FYFQIDGNLGFVAGINEMLITEENGTVELLPALPDNYAKTGSAKNMVVNGAKISFEWKDGLVIKATSDKPVCIYNKNLSQNVILSNVTIKEL